MITTPIRLSKSIKQFLLDDILRHKMSPNVVIFLPTDETGQPTYESKTYVTKKLEMFERLKIRHKIVNLHPEYTLEEIKGLINRYNNDPDYHGVMVQFPLIKRQFWQAELMNEIATHKDIDCLSEVNLAKIVQDPINSMKPATCQGILHLLDNLPFNFKGKKVTIVSKSRLIGLPLSYTLLGKPYEYTISLVDKVTESTNDILRSSDLIISGAGVPNLINALHVSRESVILDAGFRIISSQEDIRKGIIKICGDVDKSIYKIPKYVSKVPGGLGLLTVSALGQNIVNCYRRINGMDMINFSDALLSNFQFNTVLESKYNKGINPLKILLISNKNNNITEVIRVSLEKKGHRTIMHEVGCEEEIINAHEKEKPDLIVCPFLKTRIPTTVHQQTKCIIVHPGVKGDRGPHSIDHAILSAQKEWGVTCLQANETFDAGYVYCSKSFKVPKGLNKSEIYDYYSTPVGKKLVIEAVDKYLHKIKPEPVAEHLITTHKILRGNDEERNIHFEKDDTDTIVRKIKAADSKPGCRASLLVNGERMFFFLYDCCEEKKTKYLEKPGIILGKRHEAILISTIDGAVWIGHLRKPKTKFNPNPFKVPATYLLPKDMYLPPIGEDNVLPEHSAKTFNQISYVEKSKVGTLFFKCYNGSMHTEFCKRMVKALQEVKQKNISVLILAGDMHHWSKGINLNVIEFAGKNSREETMRNVIELNKVVKEIIYMRDIVTISAMCANASAGGFYMALGSDFVFAHNDSMFWPSYERLNLFGSELHSYTTKYRINSHQLQYLKKSSGPITTETASKIGIIDNLEEALKSNNINSEDLNLLSREGFLRAVQEFSEKFASKNVGYLDFLGRKAQNWDSKIQMMHIYEDDELEEMKADILEDRNGFSEK